MKVYTDSICLNCEYFNHECAPNGDYTADCVEWCNSESEFIKDGFYEFESINEEFVACSGFKSNNLDL